MPRHRIQWELPERGAARIGQPSAWLALRFSGRLNYNVPPGTAQSLGPAKGNAARRPGLQPRAMTLRSQTKRPIAALAGLCLCAAWLSAQAQKPRKASALPVRAAEAPAPFRAGERLDYSVQWAKLVNAATVRMAIVERRSFYGREAWHFQSRASTIDLMRLLFALDDQFDSYTEPSTLASLQYEMYVREQGKKENSIFRMTTQDDPAPGVGSAVRVLPGTRDPLGFFYSLRTVDWQQTREARAPVFDGKKLYEVRARLEQLSGEVSVPAGRFVASRIEVRVFERGREVSQTRFWVWLARDASRTPVLMEAEVPFGSARVALTRVQ
jgi:hypothetical protein